MKAEIEGGGEMLKERIRFGSNLKILRNKNEMTQEQLAQMIYVSRQTIANWEGGQGNPTMDSLALLHEIFDISVDQLMYGKTPTTKRVVISECFEEIFSAQSYISSISNPGFYEIIDSDLYEFFPAANFNFANIMGIAVGLKEKGYRVQEVFSNGFGIFLFKDEEVNGFENDLYDIIDEFMHFEQEQVSVAYAEEMQEKLDERIVKLLHETEKKLFGECPYYWIDDEERIRGYGKTEDGCREQAIEQGCVTYTILRNE